MIMLFVGTFFRSPTVATVGRQSRHEHPEFTHQVGKGSRLDGVSTGRVEIMSRTKLAVGALYNIPLRSAAPPW
jgi:hypothetical protein